MKTNSISMENVMNSHSPGSFMIGTIRLFSKLFCSFSKNNEVDAICRKVSMPSIIFLLGWPFCDLLLAGICFGWKRFSFELVPTTFESFVVILTCCAFLAIVTRLLSSRSNDVVWSISLTACSFFNFLRLDDKQFDGQTQNNILRTQQTNPITEEKKNGKRSLVRNENYKRKSGRTHRSEMVQ